MVSLAHVNILPAVVMFFLAAAVLLANVGDCSAGDSRLLHEQCDENDGEYCAAVRSVSEQATEPQDKIAATALLSSTYEPSVYNSLGDIHEVHKLVSEEQIRFIGDIILKYGHEEAVSVVIAHRHFDLDGTEAMVERAKSDGTAGSIASPMTLDLIAGLSGKPSTIVLGDGGERCDGLIRWFPVSYALGNEAEVRAWTDDAFLREVATYLVQNGLSHALMLAAVGDDEVKKGLFLVEKNYDDSRTSEVSATTDRPTDSITTTYMFRWN